MHYLRWNSDWLLSRSAQGRCPCFMFWRMLNRTSCLCRFGRWSPVSLNRTGCRRSKIPNGWTRFSRLRQRGTVAIIAATLDETKTSICILRVGGAVAIIAASLDMSATGVGVLTIGGAAGVHAV